MASLAARYGFRSQTLLDPDEPQWLQIDLESPRRIDRIVAVPAHIPVLGERGEGYGFPRRFKIDHADTSDEWRGCILIAAHTGLRLGDVIRLRREHVEGSRLVIRPEKTKRKRKTLSVPLTPPCLRWIGDREGDLFPSLTGRKTGTLSTQFRRIMERAGVAREIVEAGDVVKRRSFHSLRHSFASWLAEADVHADVRQRLTGHSSAGVHARYTHHDEALDRAVESLPNF